MHTMTGIALVNTDIHAATIAVYILLTHIFPHRIHKKKLKSGLFNLCHFEYVFGNPEISN